MRERGIKKKEREKEKKITTTKQTKNDKNLKNKKCKKDYEIKPYKMLCFSSISIKKEVQIEESSNPHYSNSFWAQLNQNFMINLKFKTSENIRFNFLQ